MLFDAPIVVPASMGLVIIGRNEGERLLKTLARLPPRTPAVYVDSGSGDGSPQRVRDRGIAVVELDDRKPHSPGRGRNAGCAYLRRKHPGLKLIHFHDGDCNLASTWLVDAEPHFSRDPQLAVLAGRLQELNATATVYNRLMDLEWDQPPGDHSPIGGNACIRIEAFEDLGGFNEDLLAGEEADLHLRLRRQGWVVRRIEEAMAEHDADMTRFSQWWHRHVRSGHAVAEGAHLHGDAPEQHQKRQLRSNFVWGLAVPAAAVVTAPFTLGASLMLSTAGVSTLYARIIRHELSRGRTFADAELSARYTVLSKFPQAWGQLQFLRRQWSGADAKPFDHRQR